MNITQEQFKEWNDAISCASFGNSYSIKQFKNKHPDLYRHMMAMLSKRKKLRAIFSAYESLTSNIYWGTLTWNEDEDKQIEKTKRQQALRFLQRFFKLYAFVEEYGTENGRYHVHFFGVIKEYTDYELIRSKWHSFCQIELLKQWEYKRKAKYLTKYVVKQVPRIRVDRRTVLLLKQHRRYQRMYNLGFTFQEKDYYNNDVCDVVEFPF